MDNQTTAPVEQSEQPTDVAQQPEATPSVKETVLTQSEPKAEVQQEKQETI